MNGAQEGQTVTFEVSSKASLKDLAPPLFYSGLLIYFFMYYMSSLSSWYNKVMLSAIILPIIVLLIYIMISLGESDGEGKIRFTEEGFIFSRTQSNVHMGVSKKTDTPEDAEYVFIPWNSIHRIDCIDPRREDRKRNRRIIPDPQIIFSYLDGKEFILYRGVFPEASRQNPKKRMVYEKLIKEAAQRGIPFTTELESEESWTGPIFIRE